MSHRHQPTPTNKKTIQSGRSSGTSTKNAPSAAAARNDGGGSCRFCVWPADAPVDDHPPVHPAEDEGDDANKAAFASSMVVGPALQALCAADVHLRLPRHNHHNQPHQQMLVLLPGRFHLRREEEPAKPNPTRIREAPAPAPPPQPSSTRNDDDANEEDGASISSTTSTAAAAAIVSVEEEDAANNTPARGTQPTTTTKTAAVVHNNNMVTLGRLSGLQQQAEEELVPHPIVLTLGVGPQHNDPNPNPRSVLQFRGCQVNSQSKFLILKVPNRTKHSHKKKRKPCQVTCSGIFSTVTVLGGATELLWLPTGQSEEKCGSHLQTVDSEPQPSATLTQPSDNGNHNNKYEQRSPSSPHPAHDSLSRAREEQKNGNDDEISRHLVPPSSAADYNDDKQQESPIPDSIESQWHTLEKQSATPTPPAVAPTTTSHKKHGSSPSRPFPTGPHASSSSNQDDSLVHSGNKATQNHEEIAVDSSSNNNQQKRRSSRRLHNNYNNRELKLEQPDDSFTQNDDDTNASERNDEDDYQPEPPAKKRTVRRSATKEPLEGSQHHVPAKTVPSPIATKRTTRQTVSNNSLEPTVPQSPNGFTALAVDEEEPSRDGTDSSTAAVLVVRQQPSPSTRPQPQRVQADHPPTTTPRDNTSNRSSPGASIPSPLSTRKRRRPPKKLLDRSVLELANDDEFAFLEE